MFTGLVQQVGRLALMQDGLMEVQASTPDDPWTLGESVAVNGCCLTVVNSENDLLRFDLSDETLRRTSFKRLQVGDPVNLERAMRPMDRFGGHIVQGHVDGVGEFLGSEKAEFGAIYRFRAPQEGARYLIDKGSIAVDGISLTVVSPKDSSFETWIIPHTLAHTTLHALKRGDPVNVEYDVIARHVERLMLP